MFAITNEDGGRIHISYEDGHHQITILAERWPKRNKGVRYYISGADDVDYSDLYKLPNYWNDKNLSPEFKRRNRIEIANMRKVLDEGIRILQDSDYANCLSDKYSFSRYGGCRCGCSPAFVGQQRLISIPQLVPAEKSSTGNAFIYHRAYRVSDVWITRKEESSGEQSDSEHERAS